MRWFAGLGNSWKTMSALGTERTVRLDSDLYSLADTNQPHIPAFQIISGRYYLRESPRHLSGARGFVFFHREYMYESV